ncbi:MAG TPA: cation-transporting P-type ATPase [Stellaceae bacterium]|nr:cation-transporting P-type ATPase [Stellaceae bacterium]
MDDATAPAPGLSEAEAAARLRVEGFNELPGHHRRTAFRILIDVVSEPMFALLLGAALVYFALGDLKEAVVLLVFACTSVSIALIQEARTERVLESLRDLTSPRALVIRGGIERRIPGREVVRGDIVVLAEGDRVPADALLLSGHDLQADESLLTGESVPVRKRPGESADLPTRPGGDDLPYVYSGSVVVRGRGHAQVTATGAASEIGKIGRAIARIETEPPLLRRQTRQLVTRFAVVSLGVSALATVL